MTVVIRADASVQIGTGHVMRCLTLAAALQKEGAEATFICREHPGHLFDLIESAGHRLVRLPAPTSLSLGNLAHAHWLGVSQEEDAQATRVVLEEAGGCEWLVVDHYALDAEWETAMRPYAKHVMVIDDLADRTHDCDLLLDQNFYADMSSRYDGKVTRHCQLLLGPRYALLRDEFRLRHEQVKPRTGAVKRVLVFFGGVDADNYTGRAVEALAATAIQGLQVDVVIGAQHPCRELVEVECARHGFACYVQTSRMAELMAGADLAIGAGGATTWERCCLGVPTLAFCTAENQREQIADAATEGLLYAPELKEDLITVIQRHVSALAENGYLRRLISRNSMRAVDGRGILRVIATLGCGGIEIRYATLEDSEKLFEWRNHPAIRAVSRSTDVIDREGHQKWLASVLSSTDKFLLIGQRDGLPVGVVRFDTKGDEAEVSIYLVPGHKQAGRGRELLQSAERWLAANRQDVCMIRAHVLGNNVRSQYLFSGTGYQVESTYYSKRLH